MGLDTYAVKPEKAENGKYDMAPPDGFEGINLCGGMFSGGGASFRGKVYSDMIEEVTGESLYQEFISPETVAKMADALAANEDPRAQDPEYQDLVKFFAVCKAKGYGLVGWW